MNPRSHRRVDFLGHRVRLVPAPGAAQPQGTRLVAQVGGRLGVDVGGGFQIGWGNKTI